MYKYAYESFVKTQVNALSVFDTGDSVYVVFALSALTYVWGFVYHACALGFTVLYHQKRAIFVPTTAAPLADDDEEAEAAGESADAVDESAVGLGASPPSASPHTGAPGATSPSDAAGLVSPSSRVSSRRSARDNTPNRGGTAGTPAMSSPPSRTSSRHSAVLETGSSFDNLRQRVSQMLDAAVEATAHEARDRSTSAVNPRWSQSAGWRA